MQRAMHGPLRATQVRCIHTGEGVDKKSGAMQSFLRFLNHSHDAWKPTPSGSVAAHTAAAMLLLLLLLLLTQHCIDVAVAAAGLLPGQQCGVGLARLR